MTARGVMKLASMLAGTSKSLRAGLVASLKAARERRRMRRPMLIGIMKRAERLPAERIEHAQAGCRLDLSLFLREPLVDDEHRSAGVHGDGRRNAAE
jgi:hypothetical protein